MAIKNLRCFCSPRSYQAQAFEAEMIREYLNLYFHNVVGFFGWVGVISEP